MAQLAAPAAWSPTAEEKSKRTSRQLGRQLPRVPLARLRPTLPLTAALLGRAAPSSKTLTPARQPRSWERVQELTGPPSFRYTPPRPRRRLLVKPRFNSPRTCYFCWCLLI